MLVYGYPEGKNKLTHVRDVSKGISCNCFCPGCGDALVAHQGKITQWHFKHVSGSECSGGVETALHIRAKELIETKKKFLLPRCVASYGEGPFYQSVTVIGKPLMFTFDKVECEVSMGSWQPDVLAHSGDRQIAIEIAVTHKVDKEKRRKIKESGISCVEVDLSHLYRKSTEVDDEDIDKALFGMVKHKRWVFNTHYEGALKKATELSLKAEAKHQTEYDAYHNYSEDVLPSMMVINELHPASEFVLKVIDDKVTQRKEFYNCPVSISIPRPDGEAEELVIEVTFQAEPGEDKDNIELCFINAPYPYEDFNNSFLEDFIKYRMQHLYETKEWPFYHAMSY